jgi:AcrR family transcriptional regulator
MHWLKSSDGSGVEMCPRRYTLGLRRRDSEVTRAKILEATRGLLGGKGDPGDFSMDAVAEKAGVSRMTVYNQFRSEAGLLEGLADHLALRGGMERMPEVFLEPSATEALRKFFATFVGFWSTDRLLMRRLRAFGVLHPSLYRALRDRDEWRREAAETLVSRLAAASRMGFDRVEAIDLLAMLSSFETYEALAAEGRSPEQVARILTETVLRSWNSDRPRTGAVRRPPRTRAERRPSTVRDRGSGGESA